MSDEPQEKKIIVDEDWKTQVEREREEQSSNPTPEPPTRELPPPSMPLLITTLATQALAAMGQIPDPVENRPVVNLDLAKHHIEMLGLLDEKTKGNLDDEEAQMLTTVLHQLRLAFVQIEGQPPTP